VKRKEEKKASKTAKRKALSEDKAFLDLFD